MKSPKPFATPALILLAVLTGALFLIAQPVSDLVARSVVRAINTKLTAAGVRSEISIERSNFSTPLTWVCSGMTISGSGQQLSWFKQGFSYQLTLAAARVSLDDPRAREFRVTLTDLLLRFQPHTRPDQTGFGGDPIDIYVRQMQIPVRFKDLHPRLVRRDILESARELKTFFKTGRSPVPLTLTGKIYFNLDQEPAQMSIHTEKTDQVTRLVIDREDLLRLGGRTEEGLTPAEADLLLSRPTDAPRLLLIQRYASRTARDTAQRDPRVPEDAYRHVLWSYLLTKAFGAEFAKQVTDAHETGVNKKVNTAADHAMDFNNNRIGMHYADMDIPESGILSKILSDPHVVLSASDPRST